MDMIIGGSLARFGKVVDEAGTISIVSHMHPDGDAVGSSVAMYSFLTDRKGKDAAVILPDAASEQLRFIAEDCRLIDADSSCGTASERIASSDLIICLDFNNFSRAGILEQPLRDTKCHKVLVDHHLDPAKDDFDLVISDPGMSSTSELLYHLLCGLPEIGGDAARLPKACARALMTGMTTDTNNFANSATPSTFRMASELIAAGTDRDEILQHIYNSYRENRLRAMSLLLGKMRITEDGVAYMVLTLEEKTALDIREGDTEAFVNIPLSVGNVHMSIFLKEEKDLFRVSIRSKKGWSANRLAREYFNGGGHECAAGGRLNIPQDIDGAESVSAYIEEATARFLHSQQSAK